jgi:type I restriction-modification system DNA methylase subunit
LGQILWNIADQLRGAMNADDFRDYLLSFLFLRYPKFRTSAVFSATITLILGSKYFVSDL